MQKINKSKIAKEDDNYYFNLLNAQNNVCAFTEKSLNKEKSIIVYNWSNNQCIKVLTPTKDNNLEHLYEIKDWLWNDIFILTATQRCNINMKKNVSIKLKPDFKDYDPSKYLQFDFEVGIFFPHINLSNDDKQDVFYMIEALGINCIADNRKLQLEDWIGMVNFGIPLNPKEYITAWGMIQNENYNS